jgi:Raf kinase inhibitor-like YbhB/YbcL family protein
MKVLSSAFKNNSKIPLQFTPEGENINPPFTLSDLPVGTVSVVAMIVDDDSKPLVGFDWVHWLVFDIRTESRNLKIDSGFSGGVLGNNSSGKPEYEGPAPPVNSGVHNYLCKFYALDTLLNLPVGTSNEEVAKAMEGHVLEMYEYIGEYWNGDVPGHDEDSSDE